MAIRPEDFRMPLGDHLEELRTRLIFCLIAPLILAVPALYFGKQILEWLLHPIRAAMVRSGLPSRIQLLSPTEPMISYFKIALLAAVLAAAPVILWQLWKFIEPGLYNREKKVAYYLLPGSTALLLLGIVFNYYVVFPMTLRVLIAFAQSMQPTADVSAPPDRPTPPEILDHALVVPQYEFDPPELQPFQMYYNTQLNQLRMRGADGRFYGVDLQVDTGFAQQYEIKAYLNMMLGMTLAFALAFQLPLVLLLLGWVGIVDIKSLKYYRRHALLGCAVAAAILTPPDVTSQIALLIPLYGLYELSIILLRFIPLSGSPASSQ